MSFKKLNDLEDAVMKRLKKIENGTPQDSIPEKKYLENIRNIISFAKDEINSAQFELEYNEYNTIKVKDHNALCVENFIVIELDKSKFNNEEELEAISVDLKRTIGGMGLHNKPTMIVDNRVKFKKLKIVKDR